MGPVNEAWATKIIDRHGNAIGAADPMSQGRMQPRPEGWRKHHVDDEDVESVLTSFSGGLHRTDLLELAARGLDDSAVRRRTFVATMMWGVGDGSRMYGRHRRLFTSPELPGALASSVEMLRCQEPERAFGVMEPLPGLTYRFHTKWLWVVGRTLGTTPTPLIYDNRVWASLRELQWPGLTKRQGMPARWESYIRDAGFIARRLDVPPEHVEYWLFMGSI